MTDAQDRRARFRRRGLLPFVITGAALALVGAIVAAPALSSSASRGASPPPAAPEVEESPGTQLYAPTRQEWAVLYMKATKTLVDGSRYGISRLWSKGKDSESVRCTLVYGKDVSQASLDGLRRSAERAFEDLKKEMGWSWLKLEVVTQTGTPVLELQYP